MLAFLDVDDLWTPDHLQTLLPHLLADPELHFVWGAMNFVRLEEDAAGTRVHSLLRENVPLFVIGAAIFRRSAFVEVGPFDPALRIGEDTDWLAKSRYLKTAQKQISDLVLTYRKRKGSLTDGRNSIPTLDTMTLLHRSIRRHRAVHQT